MSGCVSAFEPVGNSFYFVPSHSDGFHTHSSLERTGWREEEGVNLTAEIHKYFQDLLWSKCAEWAQIKVPPERPELFSRPPAVEGRVKARLVATSSNHTLQPRWGAMPDEPSKPVASTRWMSLHGSLLAFLLNLKTIYLTIIACSLRSQSLSELFLWWWGMLMAHSTTKPASLYLHSFSCPVS